MTSGIEFAIRAPLWDGLSIRPEIAKRKRWTSIGVGIDAFSTKLFIPKWKLSVRVVIYRKKVSHATSKNFQMDFLDPNDGHYEYSAFATNKTENLKTLWEFMAGRGAHEKTLSELKQHLAFDTIPTNDWDANSTWQLISALTHNVVRQFQITTGAVERANGRKRTYRWVLESLRTLRFELIHLPAKIARPAGRLQLRIAASPEAQNRVQRALDRLPEAA